MIYWFNMPLKAESIRLAQLSAGFENPSKKEITDRFFEELKVIAKSKQNFLCDSFGVPGSGKSYQVLRIAEKYARYRGQRLKIENVWFTISEALDGIEKMKKGSIGILDETIHTFGTGSKVERTLLNNIEMVVRAHRLSFFFLAPMHVRHNYHYYLMTWQMGKEGEEWDIEKPIETQWQFTKSFIYDHMGQCLGYIITDTPKNKNFLAEYEKKKDKFITAVRMKRGGARHEHLLKRAFELLEDPEFFERYMQMFKTKRLKKLAIRVSLKGEIMSIEEINILVDYIDYVLNREPKFKNKMEKWFNKEKKKVKK